jgi:hypothetical protein
MFAITGKRGYKMAQEFDMSKANLPPCVCETRLATCPPRGYWLPLVAGADRRACD